MSDPSAILTFLVDESAKFHNALAAAVKAWADSGSVPKELIPTPKKTKQKRAKSLIPRKPSGYTLFVTEHIANLRAEGIMSSKEKGKGEEEGRDGRERGGARERMRGGVGGGLLT